MMLNDEWNKIESPYDIQWEYQTTTMLSYARIGLMKMVLSDDNFISNLIKKKQKKYYEIIKKRVPADDLVVDITHWTIEYFPYLYTNRNNKKLNSQLKDIFDRLIEGKSRIKGINEEVKYDVLNTVIVYFLEIEIPNKLVLEKYFLKKYTSVLHFSRK